MAKIKEVEEELYVLYYDGKPLHMIPERYYEWNPTKKVYWSIPAANLGIKNLPKFIDRDKITIVKYIPESIK